MPSGQAAPPLQISGRASLSDFYEIIGILSNRMYMGPHLKGEFLCLFTLTAEGRTPILLQTAAVDAGSAGCPG
jgi:hypothetical protein